MADTRVKRPVTQLAKQDLNLLVILRELIRHGSEYALSPLAAQLAEHVEQACAAAERVFAAESGFDPATSDREFTLLMADYTIAGLGDRNVQLLTQRL